MKQISHTTTFTVYENTLELPQPIASLMERAVWARKNAYAPYSEFRVGAALLLEDGSVVLGSNQENAAYPSGLCAERVAVFQCGAVHPGKTIVSLAISAGSDHSETDSPIPPCGACRQSIAEYESRQEMPIAIYFMGESGPIYKSDSLANLLPFTFDKRSL